MLDQIIKNCLDQMQEKNLIMEDNREYYQYAMELLVRKFDSWNNTCGNYMYAGICEWGDFSYFIFGFTKKNWWFSYEDV